MIPTLLSIAAPVAIMIACGVLGGYGEGLADARRALANKPLQHGLSAFYRVMISVGTSLLLTSAFHGPWWIFIPLALIGLSAFNPVFRYTMNKKRGKHVNYVAPWSNKYDRFMLRTMVMFHGWGITDKFVAEIKADYAAEKPAATRIIDCVGRVAYIAEISCLITSALLYGTGVILSNTN